MPDQRPRGPSRCLVALLGALLCLGLLVAPTAAQGEEAAPGRWGCFTELGLAVSYHQDIDISRGILRGMGFSATLAAPLLEFRGHRLDLRLEGYLGHFEDYDVGVEVGLIPGLRLYSGSAGPVLPYFEVGVGPAYNSLDIPELGEGFNFLSYAGVGLRIPLEDGPDLELGFRMRHVSNAGLFPHNHGATSLLARVGLNFSL